MVNPRRMLADVKWLYPRPVTTLAVETVCVSGALVARSLLPPTWRPAPVWWAGPVSLGTYVVLRLGSHTGWSKRFKHTILDWFAGDVDDAQTWILAVLSSAGIFFALRLLGRGLGSMNSRGECVKHSPTQ